MVQVLIIVLYQLRLEKMVKKNLWDFRILSTFCFSAIDGKKGLIYQGKPKEGSTAQVTITVDDTDFVSLAQGKANAPAVRFLHEKFLPSSYSNFPCIFYLFAKGKLKIKGNVMLAQKLSTLFKEQSKL
mgnify:CR=1 FL=1